MNKKSGKKPSVVNKKPKSEWFWREGFPSFGAASEIGAELVRLASSLKLPNDALKPTHLVEAAQDGKTYPVLHKALYNINDTEAALKWRIDRARFIIRGLSCRIIDNSEKILPITRISVKSESNGRVYVPVPEAVRIESYKTQMIADALRGIEGWQARYNDLAKATDDPHFREAFRLIELAVHELRKSAANKKEPPSPSVSV